MLVNWFVNEKIWWIRCLCLCVFVSVVRHQFAIEWFNYIELITYITNAYIKAIHVRKIRSKWPKNSKCIFNEDKIEIKFRLLRKMKICYWFVQFAHVWNANGKKKKNVKTKTKTMRTNIGFKMCYKITTHLKITCFQNSLYIHMLIRFHYYSYCFVDHFNWLCWCFSIWFRKIQSIFLNIVKRRSKRGWKNCENF